LTHIGIINQLSKSSKLACEKLQNAVELFRECEVRRGLAWSLSYLALCRFSLCDRDGAIKALKESLKIYADIGECSVDYLELIKEFKQQLLNQQTLQSLNAEIRRVSAALNDLSPKP
jgi:tetratricopeptide (TPR) repeat protein